MAKPISSSTLGMGGGTLNYDVIEKLKEQDEKIHIDPLDRRIEKEQIKQEASASIMEVIDVLANSVEALSDDVLFAKRQVKSGDKNIVDVEVEDGVTSQDVDIKVKQLAQEHIMQSKAFLKAENLVNEKDATLKVGIEGQKLSEIEIPKNSTLYDLAGAINEKSNKITASVINTAPNEWRLVLSANEEGRDTKISIEDKTLNLRIGNELENNELQKPQNAIFTYNNMEIARSSNTVTDLVQGMTLNLKNVSKESIKINIETDKEAIFEKVGEFVQSFNALNKGFDELLKYDPETKEAGLFQGESTFVRFRQDIAREITNMGTNGQSLADYGFELQKDGSLQFDTMVFSKKFELDPQGVQAFFMGKTIEKNGEEIQFDGVFKKIDEVMKRYTNAQDGYFITWQNTLTKEIRTTRKEKEDTVERLETKYDMMTQKFAAYDDLMSKTKNSFAAVKSQIDFATAKK